MIRLRLIAASTLSAALLVGPGSALATHARPAAADTVRATSSTRGKGRHQRVRLKIRLNGAVAYDQIVTSKACPPGCSSTPIPPGSVPIRAVALQAYGVPDVVLGLYSGGAHCCYVDQVYRLDPATNRFVKTEHDFLDAGARIEDLNGNHNYEFLSADARLSEAGFTDYAHSPAPLQIWAFSGHAFHDVTRSYGSRLTTDAATWLRAFHRQHGNGRGLIAAWAADEYLLKRPGLVSSELAGALKAGKLGVPKGFGGPPARTFVTQLPRLLRRLGYAH